jgi:Domain of unknown function (DUF1929)/IPT/TIG domain/Glyoxal oxidase N-terminus
MSPSARARVMGAVLGIFVAFGVLVPGALGQGADVIGSWSTMPYLMPTNSVHAALLYNGKVLVIAGSKMTDGTPSKEAALWDPQAGTITVQSTSYYMFCNGMIPLADGRVLIAGGQIQSSPTFLGSPQASIYDPATNAFTTVQNMAHGRWYPTVTMLNDGRVMTFSGLNETTGSTNNTVEIYTVGSGWSAPSTANWTPPLYPRMHILPNGNIFYSGASATSRLFNPTTNAWTTVANTVSGILRTYGSSVLLPLTPANNYDPRIMILGGGVPTATPTTEIIDMGASSPAWHLGPDMSQPRVEMVAVLLPTGKVLAMAGSATDEDGATASLNADLYDPEMNTFSSAGANAFPRMYHTEALLMPDATVWLAGSNPSTGVYEQHMEIYKPAYLFTRDANNNVVPATRPTISSAPSGITWGAQFSVSTPDAADIASAVLMKTGSSTHGFDMNARLVGLNFTAGSGTLTLTGPPNANIAPPGYYLLFLLDTHGVPSVAKFVLLSGSGSPPPPPPGGISLVQSNSAPSTIQASNSTVSPGYLNSQTAGDLNVVVVGWGNTASISGVSDSKGNPYTLAVGPTSGNGLRQSIYYAKNIAGGTNTVTVTFSPAAAYPDVRILEYSGVDTSAPLDVAVGAAGTGTAANSGSASTTTANELIFGAGTSGTTFSAAGSGFTQRMIDRYGNLGEDKTVTSTGTYNATATDQSGVWVMQMATFRGSGQNPPPPPPPPAPSSISPVSGTTAGGTPVTITGTGFLAGAAVSFGGTAATGVTFGSSTTITATTPAHAAGAVNVVVTNTDGQSGTLTNGYTYTTSGGGGVIGFVQSNSGPSTIQASNKTVAVTYTVAETAGDLNLVVVGWGDTTSTISTVSDSKLNAYTLAVGPTSGSGLRQSIYYARNIAAGSNTVTVTFNQAAAYPDVRILEYKGLDPTAPLDVAAGAAGTGTAANSGSVTTTAASELIFGAGTSGTRFTAPGTGFTSRMINLYGNIAEDKMVNATGSYNATATDSSGIWVMQVVALKAKINVN